MKNANIDYDIIGASYYPYWHGTPEELIASVQGKDLEYVYMTYLEGD